MSTNLVMHDNPLTDDARLANYHPLTHNLLADDVLLHNDLLRSDDCLRTYRLSNELLRHNRLVNQRHCHDGLGINLRSDDGLDSLTRTNLRCAEQRDGSDDGCDESLNGITLPFNRVTVDGRSKRPRIRPASCRAIVGQVSCPSA